MNIKDASAIIVAAAEAGTLSAEQAQKAQAAIRAKTYYGNPMNGRSRYSIIVNRYGLVA